MVQEERGWLATNAVRRRQGQGCSCALSPPGCCGMGEDRNVLLCCGGVVICNARMVTVLDLVNTSNTDAMDGEFKQMQLIF